MEIVTNILSGIVQLFNNVLLGLLSILPGSPFRSVIDSFDFPFLPWLNFFIPFDLCLAVLELWLAAIILVYAYQYAQKGIKMLKIFK